jgi:hypothetical protein
LSNFFDGFRLFFCSLLFLGKEGGGVVESQQKAVHVRRVRHMEGKGEYVVCILNIFWVYITLASARSFAALSRALVFDADVLVPVTPFAYFGKCHTSSV